METKFLEHLFVSSRTDHSGFVLGQWQITEDLNIHQITLRLLHQIHPPTRGHTQVGTS